MSEPNGLTPKVHHPIDCVGCGYKIFVRRNGTIVAHYASEGNRCACSETLSAQCCESGRFGDGHECRKQPGAYLAATDLPPKSALEVLGWKCHHRPVSEDGICRKCVSALPPEMEIPHAPECDSIRKFTHSEPCPFWTKNYCLMEPCIHGIPMKDHCDKCGPQTGLRLPKGWVPCGPAPCNCFRAALLDTIRTLQGELADVLKDLAVAAMAMPTTDSTTPEDRIDWLCDQVAQRDAELSRLRAENEGLRRDSFIAGLKAAKTMTKWYEGGSSQQVLEEIDRQMFMAEQHGIADGMPIVKPIAALNAGEAPRE